jgi:hypothetical protein
MPMTMQGDKTFYECFLCSQPFQFGPHVYNGRHIPQWDVQLCDRCLRGNWDGIVLEGHPNLKRHLAEKGVEIRLNARGWLDIPPR